MQEMNSGLVSRLQDGEKKRTIRGGVTAA